MNTRAQLHKHNDRTLTDQICTLLEAILNQNYFTYQTQTYRPTKGVAMGSPISGLVAEIYLQSLEHTHIKPLLDIKHIKNVKWDTFTFMSPNIRKVTNLFKQAGIKIAFRGTNTLARLVKQQKLLEPHHTTNPVFINWNVTRVTSRI